MLKNKLSVIIITRNEEKMLPGCLASIKWADEIIVVDDMSSDKTASIAKNYGAKVFSRKQDTRGKQWRFALSKAKNSWILLMAADERIPKILAQEIGTALKKPVFDAYNIYFHQFFLGQPLRPSLHGGHPRLFKKTAGYFSLTSAHEGPFIHGTKGQLQTPIQHFSYQSIEQVMKKFNQYSSEEAYELHEKGFRHNILRLFLAPIHMFFYRQINEKDYESGFRGLILSCLFSLYIFLKWIKLWEIEYAQKQN